MTCRKRELAKLTAMPESEIDLSDLPELTEKFWQNAVPSSFYCSAKKQVTLRGEFWVDVDILACCASRGRKAINRG